MSDTNGFEPSGLQDFSLHEEDKPKVDLEGMSREELLELHAKIETQLGGLTLGGVNLVKETILQIERAKALQETASEKSSGVPMNQRAQVQNSLANLLTQLGKIQADLYSSERIKRIQSAVVKIMKKQSKKVQEEFFQALEVELEQAAQETDQVEVSNVAH